MVPLSSTAAIPSSGRDALLLSSSLLLSPPSFSFTTAAATSPIMERTPFRGPSANDPSDPILAIGWIEQYRRSKLQKVWKEVVVSLVKGRPGAGEETTLWIQREMTTTTASVATTTTTTTSSLRDTGIQLERLQNIPLSMIQSIQQLHHHVGDNRFAVRTRYGTEDAEFLFRCYDPDATRRWVQTLQTVHRFYMEHRVGGGPTNTPVVGGHESHKNNGNISHGAMLTPPSRDVSAPSLLPLIFQNDYHPQNAAASMQSSGGIAHFHTMPPSPPTSSGLHPDPGQFSIASTPPSNVPQHRQHHHQQQQPVPMSTQASLHRAQHHSWSQNPHHHHHHQQQHHHHHQQQQQQHHNPPSLHRLPTNTHTAQQPQYPTPGSIPHQPIHPSHFVLQRQSSAPMPTTAFSAQRGTSAVAGHYVGGGGGRPPPPSTTIPVGVVPGSRAIPHSGGTMRHQPPKSQSTTTTPATYHTSSTRSTGIHATSPQPVPSVSTSSPLQFNVGSRSQAGTTGGWTNTNTTTTATTATGNTPSDMVVGKGQAMIRQQLIREWALQPPQMQQLRTVQALLATIHTTFPPRWGVGRHGYFDDKWTMIDPSHVMDDDGVQRAIRRLRFFLHPDRLPKDFNEDQRFLCTLLWDIANDAYEQYQKTTHRV